MFQDKHFRQMEYEELHGNVSEVGGKINNLSPSHDESEIVVEVTDQQQLYQSENVHPSRMIAIRDQPQSTNGDIWKAFVAFLFLCFGFLCATISLAITHDRLPDRKRYEPLPDIALDNLKNIDFFLSVAEVQIMICTNLCVLLILFHKQRMVIARRWFFIVGLLYLYRSVTIFITVLPMPSRTYFCSEQSNSTSALDIAKRVAHLISGMGLSINDKQIYCGDSIFSGHATTLILCYLIIQEYSPKKLKYLHILSLLNAVTGTIFLLVSHAHYSIDIVIAYWITTRSFWAYHSLCHSSSAKNPISREWWYRVFLYLEENSRGTLTNEFEIPCRASPSKINTV